MSSSFIHEFRLNISPKESCVLDLKLNVARQLYNACLGEGLKRLQLMRESKKYQKALKTSDKKIKAGYFKEAKNNYDFNEYSLHKYLNVCYSKTWLSEHIDSLVAQKIATRAFKAVEAFAYKKRGRPRFKNRSSFSSLEGKNNASGLRFIKDKIIWSTKSVYLELPLLYDIKDQDGVEAHALSCKTKYVRLVKRILKGSPVWYAQLIQEGESFIKTKNRGCEGLVGLDLGPSSIAIVGDKSAKLEAFCSELKDKRVKISKTQKKMSRSLRLNNAQNYENGVLKKGKKTWVLSKKYKKLKAVCAEEQRKMASTRKSLHGQLCNEIIKMGKTIKTENLSYKSWQKNFGRSIGFRAPGLFVQTLRRKAERAGGQLMEFNPRQTALSQTCHCGSRQKKALKERWHDCKSCGAKAQRDLFSAHLARYVEENRLDISQASKAWAGAETLLEQAISDLKETASGKIILASFGLSQGQSQSGSLVKEKSVENDALDAVRNAQVFLRAKESFQFCS